MSAACASKSLLFSASSSLKIDEIEKQGIVSILGSDCESRKAASLRRTLSADMSSKKWLAQNGFSPMKKIASSEKLLAVSSEDSSSERPGQDDVWRLIQSQNKKQQPGELDSWGSILLSSDHQKNDQDDPSKLPPPYVHPLVKRSTSSLSEKSLEICTESLGSETGSDGFSSYAPSETGDVEEDNEGGGHQQLQIQEHQQLFKESSQFVKYSKVAPRSFPPPLPFIAQADGPSLHMHSHREDGRLVLEAVSVPSRNYFHAQRQEGRLLLTLVNAPEELEEIDSQGGEFDDEKIFDDIEEIESQEGADEEEEEEVVDWEEKVEAEIGISEMQVRLMREEDQELPSTGVINVHRSALMMKRLIGLYNKDPTWSHQFNKAVNLINQEAAAAGEEADEHLTSLPQSLPTAPPPPPLVARLMPPSSTAAAATFNAYEYFWRKNPTVASIVKPAINDKNSSHSQDKVVLASTTHNYGYDKKKQDLVVMRGEKADYLVLRGCKETRRSLLFWEPYCIATS